MRNKEGDLLGRLLLFCVGYDHASGKSTREGKACIKHCLLMSACVQARGGKRALRRKLRAIAPVCCTRHRSEGYNVRRRFFPLEDNAAVRTRLTHSLEVAHVGRFLATSVIQRVSEKGLIASWGLDLTDFKHAFVVTVEVACLLHDIGNPPFGHFGEAAIAKWFTKMQCEKNSYFNDFTGFDGNPQGFRIVTKLNGSDGLTGMNLTLSQLASTLKYPSTPSEKSRYKKS